MNGLFPAFSISYFWKFILWRKAAQVSLLTWESLWIPSLVYGHEWISWLHILLQIYIKQCSNGELLSFCWLTSLELILYQTVAAEKAMFSPWFVHCFLPFCLSVCKLDFTKCYWRIPVKVCGKVDHAPMEISLVIRPPFCAIYASFSFYAAVWNQKQTIFDIQISSDGRPFSQQE